MSLSFNTDTVYNDQLFSTGYFSTGPMPTEWSVAIEDIAPGFGEIFETQMSDSAPWFQTALQTATALYMTDYQRRLLNVQLDRARLGLPPLSSSQVGLGVNVGLSPETLKAIALGGGAILLGVLLMRGKGRR
jgi:hypothetical protein